MKKMIKLDTRQLLGFRLLHAKAPTSALGAKIGEGKPIASSIGSKVGVAKD